MWAVAIGPGGISWTEAEIIKVTKHNVMVRYADRTARLDRGSLATWWSFWRGVRFVSSRTGRIAAELDRMWWERYGSTGSVPPSMQMPLAEAMAILGVPDGYTKDDVIRCFRRAAMKAHPDHGGTDEIFRKLVEARDRLLTALGTSAPPPKPPEYAPRGKRVIYGTVRSSARLLGTGRLRPDSQDRPGVGLSGAGSGLIAAPLDGSPAGFLRAGRRVRYRSKSSRHWSCGSAAVFDPQQTPGQKRWCSAATYH